RYIYAFWHENLVVPLSQFAQLNIRVLISYHADGQLIAQLAQHLGFGLVRGSSTRQGVGAVRQMLRLAEDGHLAVTPDRPRGPRRQLQLGLLFVAAPTGLPIVPVGVGSRRAWRMASWDRFAVPWPGPLTTCVIGEPIPVPADIDRRGLVRYAR